MQVSCEQHLLLRKLTIPSSACCLQYAAPLLPSKLKCGCLEQDSYEHRLLRTSTISFSACFLQYNAFLLPFILKLGRFVHASCEQGSWWTFTMPSSACCLQYAAFLLPLTLKLATVVQASCEQCLAAYCGRGVDACGTCRGEMDTTETGKAVGRKLAVGEPADSQTGNAPI